MKGQDNHFLSLLHTLEYFNDRLPGYDKHCPSISPELYDELVCQKCGKYFPTKTFIKMHTKTMNPSRRSGKEKEVSMMQENMDDKRLLYLQKKTMSVFMVIKRVKL